MIQGISGIGIAGVRAAASAAGCGVAAAAADALSDRAAGWVAELGGGGTAAGAGFRPDTALLARGGDIYGIGDITRDIASRVGATATEEGALRRAVEDFTREAVITSVNGADGSARAASLDRAVGAARCGGGEVENAEGVIARLERATALLRG